MTLDETVQKELDAARGYAEQGNALAMGGSLDLAKIYAGRVNQNIFARVIDFVKVYGEVGKVRRIGYKASFPVELAAAGVCAEQGSVSDMAKHLALAKEYAWQVAQNIFEQVEQIEGTGYAKAFPFELAAAGVCAEQGSVSDMAKHLALAKKYAGKVGRGIFEEVAEVRRDFNLRV